MFAGGLAAGTVFGLILAHTGSVARAQTGPSGVAKAPSPVEARGDRDVYFPNTENLAPDEMRVIACGTGMPTTRAAQVSVAELDESRSSRLLSPHAWRPSRGSFITIFAVPAG